MLTIKYIDIIAEQDRIITSLREENSLLIKRREELQSRSATYRENCAEWKKQCKETEEHLQDIYKVVTFKQHRVSDNVREAVEAYKTNQ